MKPFVTALLVLLAACSPDPSQQPAAPEKTAPPAKTAEKPSGDVISFEPPAAWTKETPTSNMRKAQYRVPDKEKKSADASLAIFYFGANAAMIEANIDRWAGQMGASDAKPETIEGKCRITLVDLSGTYAGDMGGEPIEKARMLAAVVEAPDGAWYFKMVGPSDTVSDWRDEFVTMLKGAHR